MEWVFLWEEEEEVEGREGENLKARKRAVFGSLLRKNRLCRTSVNKMGDMYSRAMLERNRLAAGSSLTACASAERPPAGGSLDPEATGWLG